MRTALSRLERDALQRQMARDCLHPDARRFWQRGDYATPDRLVCGQCGKTFEERPHDPTARH